MIMMEPLTEFPREEKQIVANLARYHRKTLPAIDHTAYGILSDEDKRRVNLMAPLLRLADALDRSHRQVVTELFCDLSDDALIVYVGSDEELPVEASAVERKGDMFRQVYRRDVQLRVLRPRLPQVRPEAAFAFEGAR